MSKWARGYSNANEVGGFKIPIPIQNTVFSSYCVEQRLKARVPIGEVQRRNEFPELNNLLLTTPPGEVLLFCTGQLFHECQEQIIVNSFKALAKDIEFHFILERQVVANSSEFHQWISYSKLKKLSSGSLLGLKGLA